jgi:flagellar assembly protein FliH
LSRILRGDIPGLERIQFRELDTIPDALDSVFEAVSCVPGPKPKENASTSGEKDNTKKNNSPSATKEKAGGKDKPKTQKKSKPETEPPQEPKIDLKGLRAEAYAQGQTEARKKMRQELDTVLQAFTQAAKELDGLRSDFLRRQGEDLVQLAMEVAEQVIAAELSLNPDLILSIVGKAMESAFEADEYRILVNPEDVNVVQENRPLLLANINGLRQIHVQGDASITRGGCKVESNKGQVDARVESKMAEIHKQLKQAVQTT